MWVPRLDLSALPLWTSTHAHCYVHQPGCLDVFRYLNTRYSVEKQISTLFFQTNFLKHKNSGVSLELSFRILYKFGASMRSSRTVGRGRHGRTSTGPQRTGNPGLCLILWSVMTEQECKIVWYLIAFNSAVAPSWSRDDYFLYTVVVWITPSDWLFDYTAAQGGPARKRGT